LHPEIDIFFRPFLPYFSYNSSRNSSSRKSSQDIDAIFLIDAQWPPAAPAAAPAAADINGQSIAPETATSSPQPRRQAEITERNRPGRQPLPKDRQTIDLLFDQNNGTAASAASATKSTSQRLHIHFLRAPIEAVLYALFVFPSQNM
jgi:hypothetical protein